ncbi:MAG: triple tyrosine motif-containing protein, partial [Bacteroidota bacterium]
FDGKRFKIYRIPEKQEKNGVAHLVEDQQGQVWALGYGQLFLFKNDSFLPAPGLPEFEKPDGSKTVKLTSLDLDLQGSPIFSAADDGLFFLKNGRWVKQVAFPKMPKQLVVHQVKITAARDTLLASSNGLMVLKNNKLQHFYPASERLKLPVFSIEEDANGNIWTGAMPGAACLRKRQRAISQEFGLPPGDKFELLFFGEKEGFTDNWVNEIFRDAEHRLWFATEVGGVFRFNNFRFISFDEHAGLSDPVVMGIVESQGAKFIGTGGEGLFKLANGKISPVPLSEQLRHIGSLHADNQGNIYLGIYTGGLWKWSRKGQAKPFIFENQPAQVSANGIFVDEKGAVWVAGAKYLLRAAPGSLDLKIRDTLSAADVRRLSPDTLLLTGAQGVWLFDEKRDTATPLSFPELKEAHNICAAVFGEVVCIGTSDRGVFIFQKSALARRSPFINIGKAEGLPSNFIYNVLAERVAVPLNPPPVPTAETVSSSNNQPFNHSTIQPSTVLRVWLGTGYGISCLTLNDDLSIQRITNYGKTDGLTGMESNRNASLQDADGSLWFGLTGGLFHFQNDQADATPAVAPVVHLASVKVFSENFTDTTRFDSTDNWTGVPLGLRLNHRQNHLTFELDGICLRNPEQVLYKYRLEGLDEHFTVATSNVITYSSLPPGKFVFRAFALTPDSLLSEKPVEYAFEITAPF